MDKLALTQDLKALIITECGKEDEFVVDDISNTEALLGPEAPLELDSLDMLQVSIAIKKKYGVRIEGSTQARLALTSIEGLVDYIMTNYEQ